MIPVSATKNDRISVVMVSYMTGPALMEAIRAVQRDPDIHELIIVDNGNTLVDRQRLLEVASRSGNIRILQGHGNIGFSRGCNYGASMAIGDYVFFLNPDAIIEAGAARKLVNAGRAANIPWIAGGMLLNSNGQEQRGPRRGVLTATSAFISFTPLHRLLGIQSIHRENQPLPDGPLPMPTVSGASMMMDRKSFEQVGGLDEGYFLHVEDIALCRFVRKAGGDVIFVPDARAMHYGSTSNVTRWSVEWYKLKGFLRYFWTSGPGLGVKLGTILCAPLMAGALFARLVLLSVRKAVRGH